MIVLIYKNLYHHQLLRLLISIYVPKTTFMHAWAILYTLSEKYIYPYLNICQERLEMNSGINEKSNCIKRSINGCFCTKIYKDWCTTIGTTPTPMLRIDQIPLWKCIIAFRPVVEVIECLVVKKGFKSSRTDSPKF